MMKMEPPTIYLPEESVDNVHRLLQVWQRLDRGRMAVELVGPSPGKEIELSREHVVTGFPTKTRSRRWAMSSGSAARNQARVPSARGTNPRYSPLGKRGEPRSADAVGLLCGRYAPAGLDAYPPVYEAQVLITEMTFFRPEPQGKNPQIRPHALGRHH